MGILRTFRGLKTTLAQNLDKSDGAKLFLCDTEYLMSKMSFGDHGYLVIEDGVTSAEIKVTKAKVGFTVEHLDDPKVWPAGSCVRYEVTHYENEERIVNAVRDYTGATLSGVSIHPDSAEYLSVDSTSGTAVLTFKPKAAEETDLCSLAEGAATHYIGCDSEGNLVRAAKPTVTGGGASFTAGEGIEITADGTISLEQVHDGIGSNAVDVDEYGRTISANDVDGGGSGTGFFAEDLEIPTGEYSPVFSIVNGVVVDIQKPADGQEDIVYQAGEGLDENDGPSNSVVFSLSEELDTLTERNGMVFNKEGRLIEVEDPEKIDQQYAKVPFTAHMSTLMKGTSGAEGHTVLSSNNLQISEIDRVGTSVDYQFTFDTPAPNDGYSVVGSNYARVISRITKTTAGFSCRIRGFSEGEELPFDVIVQGDNVDPDELTDFGYTAQ